MPTHEIYRKSGFEPERETKQALGFQAGPLEQSCPQECSRHGNPDEPAILDPLGQPLDIQAVAQLIGCSVWTIRQKYVPAGLPHLRSGPNGKLIFYKNQIVRWLIDQQQKGAARVVR